MITFHLADSLPRHVLEMIARETEALPGGQGKAESQRRLQAWLDSGYGACHLRRSEIAAVVEAQLLARDAVDYRLIEWCVMPNHVHVLIEVEPASELWRVVKNWKGPTGLICNRLLGRSGEFWFREYHDRFMRDEAHYRNAVSYIRMNPVKAGLCNHPADWMFGSARLRE